MDAETKKEELKNIIEELLKLGEDRDELQYWSEIFEDLTPEEQEGILNNLKTELEELKNGK